MIIEPNVKLVLRDARGRIIHKEKGHNLVTSYGEGVTARLWRTGSGQAAPNWIELGSGDTPVTKADTQLDTPIAASRSAAVDVASPFNLISYEFEITAPTNWNVAEAGIFDHATAGSAVARFLTQNFAMPTGSILYVTWNLVFLGAD